MTKSLESKATKIANAIRRIASELLGWAIPTWSPHHKEAYKDIPLGMAVIAIIFSLAALFGLVFSFISWIAQ
jgi:hypothetical protein